MYVVWCCCLVQCAAESPRRSFLKRNSKKCARNRIGQKLDEDFTNLMWSSWIIWTLKPKFAKILQIIPQPCNNGVENYCMLLYHSKLNNVAFCSQTDFFDPYHTVWYIAKVNFVPYWFFFQTGEEFKKSFCFVFYFWAIITCSFEKHSNV